MKAPTKNPAPIRAKIVTISTKLQKSEQAIPFLFHRPKRQKTTQQRRPNYDRLLADFAVIRRVSELRRQGVQV